MKTEGTRNAHLYLESVELATYLCTGKIDLGSLPKYEIGKWKTKAENMAQTAPSERPAHNSALNRGSKFSGMFERQSRKIGVGDCQRVLLYVLMLAVEHRKTSTHSVVGERRCPLASA